MLSFLRSLSTLIFWPGFLLFENPLLFKGLIKANILPKVSCFFVGELATLSTVEEVVSSQLSFVDVEEDIAGSLKKELFLRPSLDFSSGERSFCLKFNAVLSAGDSLPAGASVLSKLNTFEGRVICLAFVLMKLVFPSTGEL